MANGKCETCGTELRPLLTSMFCPNEDRHDRMIPPMTVTLDVAAPRTVDDLARDYARMFGVPVRFLFPGLDDEDSD